MMIKKPLTGFLPNHSSRQSGNRFPSHVLEIIRVVQKKHPNFLLCGSAALILAGVLPYREMHDLDFAVNRSHFNNWGFSKTNPYEGQTEDGYESYISRYAAQGIGMDVNVLVFDNSITLNSEDIIISQGNRPIKSQCLNDIMFWKEKYNRPKDIKDLDAIASKALEDAIFTEE